MPWKYFPQNISIAACLFLFIFQTNAQVKLPTIFSDNMILQRNKPVAIWGKAAVGEKVTVSFANQSLSTVADTFGNWQITLQPLKVSTTPASLIIQASNQITLKNILVGDVWLCSGQSNMEYTLDRKKMAAPKKGVDIAAEELARTEKTNNIRYIYVEKVVNRQPELPTKGWFDANDTMLHYITAAGYFFAKEVYEQTNIPIGIISSSWGGTRIEEWIPDWAYANSPVFKDSVTSPNFKIDGMHPGQKFNGLIKPLVPFACKGILWYQGETDCMMEDMKTYPDKFELFANTWRNLLIDKTMPIYYVQISPYYYTKRKDKIQHTPQTLAEFWEAQTKSLSLKNTGMIVTTDLVDNLADIHPSYKWIVGHRLALIALAKDYGEKKLEYSGPIYQSMKIKNDVIELEFTHTGTGLKSSDDKPLSWFTIAGEDGNFVAASAIIKGKKVLVSSPEIKAPKYVRFAWDETAQPNFFNNEGLPAVPFRTGK